MRVAALPSFTDSVAGSKPSVAVSSSLIVTVTVFFPLSSVTPAGRLPAEIVAVNVSLPSTTLSVAVCTVSVADLLPTAIVTLVAACAV